jgi:serine/threonine protein kinase
VDIYAAYGAVPDLQKHNEAVPQDMMWWDDDRVDATVDRNYVLSHLMADEIRRLDNQLEFGDGLTDDTYLEWIETKAKRIFLICVDLGVPDQIFGIIDDSWDDDDLPIPLDQVSRLQLTSKRDEKMEAKFYQRQFTYLLRPVRPGENVNYDDVELVPLEVVEKRPVTAVVGLSNAMDKVCIPGRPDHLFFRRPIPLGNKPGQTLMEDFLSDIERMRTRYNRHIVSLWGSYTHQGCGYLLLTPVHDTTLKSTLSGLPPSLKILAKEQRRALYLNWIHCLAEGLASLHNQGLGHGHIMPSNVLFDSDNNIFLADPASFAANASKGFDKEFYDYSAPEVVVKKELTLYQQHQSMRHQGGGRRPTLTSPDMSPTSTYDTFHKSPSMTSLQSKRSHPPSPPRSPPPPQDPLNADIYSLGCIFIEIISLLLKRSNRAFVSHRSAKNKTAGRGGGLPDSSFRKNPGQVESWLFGLVKDAKKKEDQVFRGISHLLNLCTRMISHNPSERPSAKVCAERIYEIVTKISGVQKTHCDIGGAIDIAMMTPAGDAVLSSSADATASILGTSLVSRTDGGRTSTSSRTRSRSGWGSRSSGNRSLSVSGSTSGNKPARTTKTKQKGSESKPRAWKAPVYAGTFNSLLLLLRVSG